MSFHRNTTTSSILPQTFIGAWSFRGSRHWSPGIQGSYLAPRPCLASWFHIFRAWIEPKVCTFSFPSSIFNLSAAHSLLLLIYHMLSALPSCPTVSLTSAKLTLYVDHHLLHLLPVNPVFLKPGSLTIYWRWKCPDQEGHTQQSLFPHLVEPSIWVSSSSGWSVSGMLGPSVCLERETSDPE